MRQAPGDLDVRARLADRNVYYGWIVVGTCFAGSLGVYGLITSFGVFLGHIVDAFDLTLARASVVFSVQSAVLYGGSSILGFLVDRYSTRRLYAAGALLLGVGLFGASRAGSVTELTVWYGVVAGTGAAIIVVIAYVTPPQWFTEHQGLATGIAASGSGLGAITVPPLASFLILQFGWRDAYLALATLAVTLLLFAATLVAQTPETLDGEATPSERDDPPPSGPSPSMREQLSGAVSLMNSRAFLLFLVAYGGVYAPVFAISAHIVEYTSTAGLGRPTGIVALGIIGVTDITGKFSVGHISDRLRVDRVRVITTCGVALGVLTAALTVVPSATGLLAVAGVLGLARGGIGALLTPVLAQLFGSDHLNTLYGVASIGLAVTGAAAPYLVGMGFDLTGSFRVGMIGVGVVAGLGGISFLLADRVEPRRLGATG